MKQIKESFQKHCKQCDKGFKTKKDTKLFCSDKCRNKFWIKTHPRAGGKV